MFRFSHPVLLYLFLLLPLIVVVYILLQHSKHKAMASFGDVNLVQKLMPEYSVVRPRWKFFIVITGLFFLLLALAGPQFGSKLTDVKRQGIEIMIALDVSNSMLAADIQPNRLERAKQAIAKLVDQLSNDKIGLIVFAGDAYTQLPITTDYVSAKMFLESIQPDMVPMQGTNIASAISLAGNSFTQDAKTSKVIVLLTDGENHEDDAVQAASDAKAKGIKVYTIGVGLAQGAPIPIPGNYGQQNFKRDKDGNVVISKLDASLLQDIAAAGNGDFVRSDNTSIGLNKVFEKINSLDKTEIQAKVYSEYDEKFQFAAVAALFFLFLEMLILEKKNKYLSRIRLFKIKL
jgi:Ca-activated chloride channel homolog